MALKDYDGCRVGITLTFGWDPDINRGLAIADARQQAVAGRRTGHVRRKRPIENFGNLQPSGTVEIRMYFFRGCQALRKH